jgi:diacylglycerol kinase family enzyme
MQVVLVHNPHSGTALPTKELKRHFTDAGIEVVKDFGVDSRLADNLSPYLDQAEIIIATYGGDGTQSAVAGILTSTDAVMAPLAGGTLNHFTKDLGIDQDLDTALAALVKAKPRAIDIAMVNDRHVINNSSVGLYPSALQMRDEMAKQAISKWPAAVIATAKAFWQYRSYSVTVDGEAFRTPFVFVGNNDYRLEQRLIGDRTRLDEGTLSVYAVATAGRRSFVKIFLRALLGQLESTDEVKIWKTKELVIETKKSRVRISRDGEHEIIESPLRYKIIPGGLKIVGGSQE